MPTETPAPEASPAVPAPPVVLELDDAALSLLIHLDPGTYTKEQQLYRSGFETGRRDAGQRMNPADVDGDNVYWRTGYRHAWRTHRQGFAPVCEGDEARTLNPPIAEADFVRLRNLFMPAAIDELDALTKKNCAARTFIALVCDPGGSPTYRPSLYGQKLDVLARAYDRYQERRGDPRRAYRG